MVSLQSLALLAALSGVGQLAASQETVLLDFTADSCGPCRQMRPLVHQLADEGYPVREVNVERDRSLAAKHRVTSLPCFVMLVRGQEVDRQMGTASRARLEEMLQKAYTQGAATRATRALAQSPDSSQQPPQLDPPLSLPPHQAATPLAAQSHARNPLGPPGAVAANPRPDHASGPQSVEDRLLKATVRLKVQDETGQSYGTGTIIDARDGEALVLTCGHIFRDSQGKGTIWVELQGQPSSQPIQGRLLAWDLTRDVGLLSMRPPQPVTVALVAGPNDPASLDDRVISIGCNNGQKATVRRSRVTAIDKYLGPPNLEVAGMPIEGRSGGGLFDEQGKLIGVCFAADPQDDEGVYAGLASIHAELDRLGLGNVYQQSKPSAERQLERLAVEPPPMSQMRPTQLATVRAGSETPLEAAARSNGGTPSASDAPARAPAGQFSPAEQAALAEIAARAKDAEVICIIRPRSGSNAKSEIFVLDHASALFVEHLSQARRNPPGPRLTSLEVPTSRPDERRAVRPLIRRP